MPGIKNNRVILEENIKIYLFMVMNSVVVTLSRIPQDMSPNRLKENRYDLQEQTSLIHGGELGSLT